ncbi:hypothetical protein N7470_004657 [Penicillium chermesinum]|nr:hypothetical protein N7470_004657 [Penicillium chermesinum]
MATADVAQPAIPSRSRVEPGSHDIPLGVLPRTSTSTPENPDRIASEIITKLNESIAKKDSAAVAALFLDNSYWRDHLPSLVGIPHGSAASIKLGIDRSAPHKAPHNGPIDAFGEVHGIEFFVTATTNVGSGVGVVRLAQEGSDWKIFTAFTTLRELKGYEEATGPRRPIGVQHGAYQGRTNWQDRRNAAMNYENGKEPAVMIVGAGQGGLTAAARLKMLDVDTLVIDREERIGDSWRHRYHQLVLHDPVWYDHMPCLNFPSHWPVFTPKDKLAEFFESYVKLLELNKHWTVTVERTKEDGSKETRTFHPRHIIQATGHSGKKNMPTFKGQETFQGRLCHSSEWPGADANSAGKKAVVIGSCNSGHDIAQDYYERGYEVTMVQRSSTLVVSSEALGEIAMKGFVPPELFKTQQAKVTRKIAEFDAKIIAGLEKAGFSVDQGPMDAGLLVKYFQRGGGYYIDVGGSQLIIDGKVKVKQGQEISEILPHGVRFADGSELEADEIVFATGYQNMRSQARIIFGDEIADRVGSVWGLNEEGEFRTIWSRSGHSGFWFMGGNLALCRYYSRLLALQIKALEAGVATY